MYGLYGFKALKNNSIDLEQDGQGKYNYWNHSLLISDYLVHWKSDQGSIDYTIEQQNRYLWRV